MWMKGVCAVSAVRAMGFILSLAGPQLATADDQELAKRNAAAIRVIAQGHTCESRPQLLAVVRTEAEWTRRRTALRIALPEKAKVPVDWTKEMLAIVCLGKRPTGGFRAAVLGAEEIGGKYRITFADIPPGVTSAVTEAITYPFVVVALKRSSLPVDWKKEVPRAIPPSAPPRRGR